MRACLLLALAVSLTGCFEIASVLTVRPDGSATLRDEVTLSGMALLALREADEDGEDPFADESLGQRAEALGPGVRLLGVERSDDGYVATYAVDDVRAIRYGPPGLPDEAGDDASPIPGAGEDIRFLFSTDGGAATLRVVVPKPAPEKPEPTGAVASDEDLLGDEFGAEMLGMMGSFFEGARVRLAVAVDGEVEETNAAYAEGSEVTLIDLPFDAVLAFLGENPDFMTAGSTRLERDAVGPRRDRRRPDPAAGDGPRAVPVGPGGGRGSATGERGLPPCRRRRTPAGRGLDVRTG